MTDIQLVEIARQGNTEALDKILAKYKPLVNAIARKYFLVGAGTDDLVQEGMIGLYKACLGYKIDSSASFKTFAAVCVKRQIEQVNMSGKLEKIRIPDDIDYKSIQHI